MIRRALLVSVALLLVGVSVGVAAAHHTPSPGDRFAYNETVVLSNGVGADYSGYTESTVINGSLSVSGVLPNGTESAAYYNADAYQNNSGGQYRWTSSGTFTFSAQTFLYVQGTDNQTGYVNPYVWFYMDNTLPVGATFSLLNTEMRVVATSFDYPLGTTAGAYVQTIFTEGNGTYSWSDAYNAYDATYNWKAYFDPGTGYIVGYVYTEQDTTTNNTSGDGFTITDTLGVTQTSYPLTPGAAPPASSGSSGTGVDWTWVAIAVVVVVVIVVVVVVAIARARRRHPLPKHSAAGQVSFGAPPVGPPPPAINLTPSGQPAVQQIIIKETVKVKCQFCGSLIDSTAEKCPFCGATRS